MQIIPHFANPRNQIRIKKKIDKNPCVSDNSMILEELPTITCAKKLQGCKGSTCIIFLSHCSGLKSFKNICCTQYCSSRLHLVY